MVRVDRKAKVAMDLIDWEYLYLVVFATIATGATVYGVARIWLEMRELHHDE